MTSSRSKMLSILDLFTEQTPVWTADHICMRLGFSVSSGYRYIRELCAAGLLTRISGGAYVLGARIIQLEFLMRMIDPVSRIGRPVILDLVRQTGCDALLSNIYGNQIVNVLHERGVEVLPLAYVRGRPHPLFRGAMSKAILAFLPRARIIRLYNSDADLVERSGLGRTWREFWQNLQVIRKKGFSESYGELDPEVCGFGAPVFNGEEVLGGVGLGCTASRLQVLNKDTLVELLRAAARKISMSIEGISHPQTAVMPLSPETLQKIAPLAEQ